MDHSIFHIWLDLAAVTSVGGRRWGGWGVGRQVDRGSGGENGGGAPGQTCMFAKTRLSGPRAANQKHLFVRWRFPRPAATAPAEPALNGGWCHPLFRTPGRPISHGAFRSRTQYSWRRIRSFAAQPPRPHRVPFRRGAAVVSGWGWGRRVLDRLSNNVVVILALSMWPFRIRSPVSVWIREETNAVLFPLPAALWRDDGRAGSWASSWLAPLPIAQPLLANISRLERPRAERSYFRRGSEARVSQIRVLKTLHRLVGCD